MIIKPVPVSKIILGIDPGTQVMGYGVIEQKGSKLLVLQMGVIHLEKYKDHFIKLKKIHERITQVIQEYLPDEVAIEAPFFGKNVQSMLKLGRAQGVAIAAALARDVPVTEYLPKKVKSAVAGNGNASKEQVAAMLQNLLNFSETPEFLDATDALAVAVCHHFQGKIPASKGSSWKAFLSENPGRVK
ncbi:MAG: crossover junction endodeoxyribonuclease RuvC [Opitutaceae bacterium]|nr:crossover junction endodeoxyribonuclease RuvC [Cytophagales bacterium]